MKEGRFFRPTTSIVPASSLGSIRATPATGGCQTSTSRRQPRGSLRQPAGHRPLPTDASGDAADEPGGHGPINFAGEGGVVLGTVRFRGVVED